jgi:hypothetical protein
MDTNSNDMKALLSHLQGLGNFETRKLESFAQGEALIAVVPAGKSVQDLGSILDKYLPAPRRLIEAATLGTVNAFMDYVERFKTDQTVIFADGNPDRPWLHAIIDYHEASVAGASGPAPHFCSHTGTYTFPLSDEMVAWKKAADGSLMEMADFAFFLEERLNDISNPPLDWMMIEEAERDSICRILNLRDDHQPTDSVGLPIPFGELDLERDEEELPTGYRTKLDKLRAKRFGTQQQLLTLSQEMSVRSDTRTAQRIDLSSGAKALIFEDNQEAQLQGKRVKVPEMFLIDIPIFDGEERRLMPVRLYYRKVGTSIKWGMQLIDHRRMVRDAVEAAAGNVRCVTAVPVIFGKPIGGGIR